MERKMKNDWERLLDKFIDVRAERELNWEAELKADKRLLMEEELRKLREENKLLWDLINSTLGKFQFLQKYRTLEGHPR
jgi:hypothetical protein